jgi:isoleucyl-tRNA synthetase
MMTARCATGRAKSFRPMDTGASRPAYTRSHDGFENYQLDVATRPIAGFIDDLSVWYLRRSRERFKEEGPDKALALATLRYVLACALARDGADMPFFAEYLFQAVREGEDEESVHLAMWPEGLATANFLSRNFGKKIRESAPARSDGCRALYRNHCTRRARKSRHKNTSAALDAFIPERSSFRKNFFLSLRTN